MRRLLDPVVVASLILDNDKDFKIRDRVAKTARNVSYSPEKRWSAIAETMMVAFRARAAGDRIMFYLQDRMPEALRTLLCYADWIEVADAFLDLLRIRIPPSGKAGAVAPEIPSETVIIRKIAISVLPEARNLLRDDPDASAEDLEKRLKTYFIETVYSALRSAYYKNSAKLVKMIERAVDWAKVSEEATRLAKAGK